MAVVDTSALKLKRLRQWADLERARIEAVTQTGAEFPDSVAYFNKGQIFMLDKLIALHLLTPEESTEVQRLRRVMFGNDDD